MVFNQCAASGLEVCCKKSINSFISIIRSCQYYYQYSMILYGLVCHKNFIGDKLCCIVKKVRLNVSGIQSTIKLKVKKIICVLLLVFYDTFYMNDEHF